MTGADLPLVVASGGVEACVGVLTVGWPGAHEVGTDEETLLVGIADLAAAAIAAFRTASIAAERAEWAERISHTDPLTGLSNARTLGRVLELEVARAQRQQSEVSVAVFDIDGFTALNAAAGARAGDRALREVAAVLAETVRLVDTVARTGADEFVLVAPGSAGVLVARRVLEGISKLEAFDGHDLSVSAGVARFPQDGTDSASLIAAARAALEGSSERATVAEAGA
jgi:diguanylate cyclase (GGDEF)-like protein